MQSIHQLPGAECEGARVELVSSGGRDLIETGSSNTIWDVMGYLYTVHQSDYYMSGTILSILPSMSLQCTRCWGEN